MSPQDMTQESAKYDFMTGYEKALLITQRQKQKTVEYHPERGKRNAK